MKRILIIHTGGTISMLEDKDSGAVLQTTQHPLLGIPLKIEPSIHISEKVIFSLPSPQITMQHMMTLANFIRDRLTEFDGFIVTHGTDTLEETAYFLDLVIETSKPIVITGAMRSSNEVGSDALYNLISSIRVAGTEDANGKGVLIVMNDEIHTAVNCTKTSTSNVATFQSPQYGPIGLITKDHVLFHHTILNRMTYPIKTINKNVLLLKAYAGMDGEIVKAILSCHPDGIVIEALGQGNLPKDMVHALQSCQTKNIPIVLVSRCYKGIVQPTYGYEGGGKQLKKMGMIFASDLTGQKARIKLMVVLESQSEYEHIVSEFEEK